MIIDYEQQLRELVPNVFATVKGVESIADVLDALSEDGIEVPTIIAGGSPSFPCHAANPDVFLSPGTVFLWSSGHKYL